MLMQREDLLAILEPIAARQVRRVRERVLARLGAADHIGKKAVWRWIKSLGALEHSWHEFYIGGDSAFEWWLWLPTLVDSGHIAIGKGIEQAWIQTDGQTFAWFAFIDPDRPENVTISK